MIKLPGQTRRNARAWAFGPAAIRWCLAVLLAGLVLNGAGWGEEQAPAAPQIQGIRMNFADTPLETVLEQLSEICGLVIVKDAALEGRVTIISKQSMDLDEALVLLNSVLKEKGFASVRTGRILKVVRLDEAKRLNIPVRTGNDPARIALTDEVITQVIPIRYIDAQQLRRDFAPLIPPYADLSANASSNTLILTDTSSNIRRIVEIIQAMDTQSTTFSQVKVFPLKYANATSAARLINEAFREDDRARQQPGQTANVRTSAFGGRSAGGSSSTPGAGGGRSFGNTGGSVQPDQAAQRARRVSASADDRTNTVVVTANPETMEVVTQVLTDLDANPAEDQAVLLYRCKNAQAANLESVINMLFGMQTGRSAVPQSTQLPASGATGLGTNRTAMRGGTASPAASGQIQRMGGRTGGVQAGGDLMGQVYAVADLATNSLMVLTASKNFDRIKTMLMDLDRPVPQVLIKVLIAEVTHDDSTDIGIEASVLTNRMVRASLTDFGVAAAGGGLFTKLVDGDVTVTLRALEKVGKLEILSRPLILASDNQLSSIMVGQEVPFITNTRTTETGQTINTIQYEDIGIILNVVPHINDEGLVIMDIAPEVSSLTGTTVPISETVSAPVFAKRSAQSRVAVRDGQTVVIGGLMEDKKTDTVAGVPVISKVPGLGMFFRRKITQKSKTELLIFLTPHVALEPGILPLMAEEESNALKLVPKAVKSGAFQEHLEGLQRGGGAAVIPLEEMP